LGWSQCLHDEYSFWLCYAAVFAEFSWVSDVLIAAGRWQKLIGVQTAPPMRRRPRRRGKTAPPVVGLTLPRTLSQAPEPISPKYLSEAAPNDGVRVLRLLWSGMVLEIADGQTGSYARLNRVKVSAETPLIRE